MRLDEHAAAAMAAGLDRIRSEFEIPDGFPPEVDEAAQRAAASDVPSVLGTSTAPRSSSRRSTRPAATDLDQAFAIETAGNDIVLRYAIADVGWFVQPGDPLDAEAWNRGVTVYLPDRRSPLYPASLSEGAASLLPDVDRPAVIFVVRVDQHGGVSLDGAERAVVRSRAKLAYESVQAGGPAARLRRAVGSDRGGRIGAERGAGDVPRAGDRSATRRRLRVAVSPADAGRGAERGAVAGRQHGGRRCAAGGADRAVPGDAGGRRATRASPAPHGAGVRPRLADRTCRWRRSSVRSHATTRERWRSCWPSAGPAAARATRRTATANVRGTPRSRRPTRTRRRRCAVCRIAT